MSKIPFRPPPRRNGKIRAREVRVLDEHKEPLGVMPLSDALRLAQSRGLDLIEIAPTATPPVCRIVEYGKYQYEEAKKHKESAARQPSHQMKELQLSPNIDPHDLQTKVQHAIGFLQDGMPVRVKLRFRGRQKAHKEFGYAVVNQFVEATAAHGRADSPPRMLGDRDLNVIVSPLPREKRVRSQPAGGPTASAAPAAPAAAAAAAAPPTNGQPGHPGQTG